MAKTSELTGAKLAEWVARAQGWRIENDEGEIVCWDPQGGVHSFGQFGYRPDLNWADGGPIIDCAVIDIDQNPARAPHVKCRAVMDGLRERNGLSNRMSAFGPTPMIAAMRAYVSSKFGDTVPDEVPA